MTRTILLVDDDKDIHLSIRLIVEKTGYNFISAFDGREALRKIRSNRPDLVILDLKMPEKGGAEVYRELKTNPQYQDFRELPVIILTASNQAHAEIRELIETGLTAFLEKPFGYKELMNVVENAFLLNESRVQSSRLRQAVEESKDFLENLVSSCPLAIITADNSGIVTFISQAGKELLRMETISISSRSLSSLLQIDNARIQKIEQELDSKPSLTQDFFIEVAKGRPIPIRFTFTRLSGHDDQRCGTLVVGQDLTHQKQLERERLEKERLQAITESMATINHQINNPLTPILGNLQLLRKEKANLSVTMQKRLDAIETNATRIFKIIQEFNRLAEPATQKYYGKTNMLKISA